MDGRKKIMPPAEKKLDASCQNWLFQISTNKIETILDDVKSYISKGKNEAFAFKCILISSKLVFDDKCSSPKALSQLTDACCGSVAPNFAVDHRKLLNSLYHICRYLLKENFLEEAKLISQRVIELKSTRKDEWSTDEENTLIAIIHLFSKTLLSFNFTQNVDILISSENETSALRLWHHLLTLAMCSNKKPLLDVFSLLLNVSMKFLSDDKKKCAIFLSENLKCFLFFYENNNLSKKIVLEENTLVYFLRIYRQIVLNYISLELFSFIEDSVISILEKAESVFCHTSEQTASLRFIKKILHLLCESTINSNLDRILVKDCLSLTCRWTDKSELLYSVSFFACNIFIKLKTIWIKAQLKLPSNALGYFIKLFLRISKYLDGHRVEVCDEKCKLNCDETIFIQTTCFVFSLLLIFSSQNSEKSDIKTKVYASLFQDVSILFTDTLDFILKLYKSDCPKFADLFSFMMPIFSNSIHVYLLSAMHQNVLTLSLLFLHKLSVLPQSLLEEHFSEKYLVKFIGFVCYCSLKIDQYELVLPVIAAWIIILSSRKLSLFKLWSNFKMDAFTQKNVILKETIVSILQSDLEKFKEEWNLPSIKNEDYGLLLYEEIKAYSQHNLSCEDCFYSVFKDSQKIEADIFLEAEMICSVLRHLVTDSVSLKRMINVLDRLKEVEGELCKMKKTSGVKEKLQINITLGCLIISRARCLIIKIRDESENDSFTQSLLVDKPKKFEPGLEVNPNDVCSVTPVFSSLKLEKQQQLFDLLDDGIKYVSACCNAKMLTTISMDFSVLVESIFDSAFIYKLYGHEKSEYFAWELCFKICLLLKKDEECISAMTHILALKGTINSKWLAHTEALVQSLDSSKSHLQYAYTLACIRNKFLNQDFESVNKLFLTLEAVNFEKLVLINAEYNLLLSKCFFNPTVFPKNKALEAYVCVTAAVKDRKWKNFAENCKVNCLLFEVALNLSKNFLELMLPRETRCYLKPQLKLAQKLALPLRWAQVIAQLAWADITCCNQSESLSKITALEELLQLKTQISNLVPINSRNKRVKAIKIDPPDFVDHENCSCFFCSSPSFQAIIFETLRLQGAYTNLQPETRLYCVSFFKCGVAMLEKICRSRKEEWVQLSEVKLFVQFVDHLTLSGDLKEAIKMNKKVSKRIGSFSESHPSHKILKQEVFEQTVSLEYSLKMAV